MPANYIRVYDEDAKRHFSAVVGSSDAETLKVVDDTPGDWQPPTDKQDRPLDREGNEIKSAGTTTAAAPAVKEK